MYKKYNRMSLLHLAKRVTLQIMSVSITVLTITNTSNSEDKRMHLKILLRGANNDNMMMMVNYSTFLWVLSIDNYSVNIDYTVRISKSRSKDQEKNEVCSVM